MLLQALGLLGWAILVVLPGAWVTFALPLKGLPFWARVCIGAMLAPIVVPAQFYVLRLLGVPFASTAALLALLNLPPIYLIARQRVAWRRPDRQTSLAAAAAAAVIAASTAPFFLDPQKRLYTWEAWSQADVVYALASGHLVVEDAELAGVRLSYPWAGHAYQAVLSYALGSAPVDNYIWTNLVWVLLIFVLAAGLVAELGGNGLSRVTVAIWLGFGVNFVGYVLGRAVPTAWIRAHPALGAIWGDNRYTPWLDKLVFFGQMWFALGLFIALTYLLVRGWPDDARRSYVVLIALLLGAIGLIYPVLLPSAVAIIGARILVRAAPRLPDWRAVVNGEVLGLTGGVVIACIVTLAQVRFLTDSRASAGLVHLNDLWHIRWTALEAAVVLSPLLGAFVLTLPRYWRVKREPLVILGIGALASCGLYALFEVPWYRNEYKFIFTAAICLAPFPSLALEAALARLGRLTVPAVALLAGVLAAPLFHNVYANPLAYYLPGPLADTTGFDLRLDSREPLSALTDAVREETPVDSLLVVERADLHLPTLTRRQLYVAPAQSDPHPGILITSDQMLELVKGYPRELVEHRRATVQELFAAPNNKAVADSLAEILLLGRPVVLVLDAQHDAALAEWLRANTGESVYRRGAQELWLVRPTNDALARTDASAARTLLVSARQR